MKKFVLFVIFMVTALPVMADETLKIGLLLIEDSVPFYVAEQETFYGQQNITVELIPFLSALERDSALAAKAIDGAIADPVGAILYDKGRGELKITSLCLGKTPQEGIFAILAAPKSNIQSVADLKGVEIAVSNATIIEYVTDRMLETEGFQPTEIKKIEVKKMPIRMQMLLSGSVQAATLPEPLASIAAGKGAKILITDAGGSTSLSQTVIIFRADVLSERKKEIAGFFQAYRLAVQAINKNPKKYRALFMEKGRIPPFLAQSYPIPTYPLPEPFSKSLYQPIITWLTKKQLIDEIPYEAMIATDFMDSSH
ncbi:MAG: ABC transporter substrate-binding protein [Desulfobacterales bacterium]|nr:ABC transporter substrate-binding protein [Desulfobacterales bacterium]